MTAAHRLALVACLGMATTSHAICEDKEYAQLKDEAKTPVGRMMMAFDMCMAQTGIDNAKKEADLALQYRQVRDAEKASRQMSACISIRSKISTALIDAKASKAIEFANAGCKGQYPK